MSWATGGLGFKSSQKQKCVSSQLPLTVSGDHSTSNGTVPGLYGQGQSGKDAEITFISVYVT